MRAEPCVVVGAGHAAVSAAMTLRNAGFVGGIEILGEEPDIPYQRPLLSKRYLEGLVAPERLPIRPRSLYERLGISMRTGAHVTAIDRDERRVVLADGSEIGYCQLLLATGSRARELDVPGCSHPRVHRLRSRADADRLRAQLAPDARLVVIGGGYAGLEVAAAAVKRGLRVTVLEAANRLLARVTGHAVSTFLHDAHRAAGVDVHTSAQVSGVAARADDSVAVSCRSGDAHVADVVLVAIGASPNVSLARDAGLPCEDGIVVDERARTADPHIFAAGDTANHPSRSLGRRLRLESVHNAAEQAKVAARTICGDDATYDQLARFWSDQYDHRLQSIGVAGGHDEEVVRGDPASGAFTVIYLRDGQPIAIDAVNEPTQLAAGRSLLLQSAPISRACIDAAFACAIA